VGRVANEVSGVGVYRWQHPHPDPLRGSTLPTRGRVKAGTNLT
jgi:hypothetical protein